MSSFTIPSSSSSSSSSFSLSSTFHQPSRLCFILRNPRSNFEFRGKSRRTCLRLSCSSKPPGTTGSGENENRSVLDAFFLGKALAEVINERIESTVGEVLGTIGRFQAEQQKQVQEIQEEVLERAKRAKERAARETMEAQGLVASKPASINQNPDVTVVTSVTPASSTVGRENLSGFPGSSTGDPVESSSSSDDEDSLNNGS